LCKAYCGELTTGLIFTENGKHLITTSSLGVIYVWKLPEEVTKLIANKKLALKELPQIDEDEMEDSMKRGSSNKQQEKIERSANFKDELDGIFA
jgi:hypothetical protein